MSVDRRYDKKAAKARRCWPKAPASDRTDGVVVVGHAGEEDALRAIVARPLIHFSVTISFARKPTGEWWYIKDGLWVVAVEDQHLIANLDQAVLEGWHKETQRSGRADSEVKNG